LATGLKKKDEKIDKKAEKAATVADITARLKATSTAVLADYRGRGLYRALVQARLAHARARGITLATSHAHEATSAPILETLGFETVCRFPMYFG